MKVFCVIIIVLFLSGCCARTYSLQEYETIHPKILSNRDNIVKACINMARIKYRCNDVKLEYSRVVHNWSCDCKQLWIQLDVCNTRRLWAYAHWIDSIEPSFHPLSSKEIYGW
jgi:hypothetical protein